MAQRELQDRIVVNPDVLDGKPVIRGTRLSVQFILGQLVHGASVEEIVQEYEGLTHEDVTACLMFGATVLEDMSYVPQCVS